MIKFLVYVVNAFSGCLKVHNKNNRRVCRAHQTSTVFKLFSHLVRTAYPT
ncbi:hypothetical protein [Alysiella crassa]|nr:hypothetical protein [Alysiella crassa]UOP06947.1 hypothetical protein LVJ80_00110 [Alysiella crassa]